MLSIVLSHKVIINGCFNCKICDAVVLVGQGSLKLKSHRLRTDFSDFQSRIVKHIQETMDGSCILKGGRVQITLNFYLLRTG